MKRLMVLDQKGSLLLSDILNQRILRELALSPYSTTELARKLGVPAVKVWRRISKLLMSGVIEQSKLDHVGNLEKKIYRATSLKYLPPQFLEFEPKSKPLKEAYNSYVEIQREFLKDVALSNEIPQSVSLDPIDYGVYADLKNFCKIMLSSETIEKIQQLQSRLDECKEFEALTETVSYPA